MSRFKIDFTGEVTLTPITDTTPVVTTQTTTDQATDFFYGLNDFHWVPLEKLTPLGLKSIRLYIASGWLWRPNGLFCQPLYQAETPTIHGLDDYFAAAKAAGLDILPCINKSPDWYAGESDGSGSNNYPPIKPGKDRAAASSYQDYADFWFQFVARYGSVKHPDSVLRVDTTPKYENQPLNIKKSGLALIQQVEIGNEWDRWWDVGTERYMKPEEHAALLWACYAACKKADPSVRVVMGGLTGFDVKYLKAMLIYFQAHGVKFQSDEINVHHYSSAFNQYGVWPPTWKDSSACFPEQDKDFPMIAEVVKFGASLGLDTIVTEFGADSKAPSWMHIHVDGMSDEDAQAELIVRTFKLYKSAGVKRAYVFTAVNEPGSGDGGLWENCGLMENEQAGFKPKPAYYAVQKLVRESKPA